MATANMEMKVTVELSEEDRKRIDDLIGWLKASQSLRFTTPPAPVPMPTWPAPWQSPVYCGSEVATSDSTNQFTYNA